MSGGVFQCTSGDGRGVKKAFRYLGSGTPCKWHVHAKMEPTVVHESVHTWFKLKSARKSAKVSCVNWGPDMKWVGSLWSCSHRTWITSQKAWGKIITVVHENIRTGCKQHQTRKAWKFACKSAFLSCVNWGPISEEKTQIFTQSFLLKLCLRQSKLAIRGGQALGPVCIRVWEGTKGSRCKTLIQRWTQEQTRLIAKDNRCQNTHTDTCPCREESQSLIWFPSQRGHVTTEFGSWVPVNQTPSYIVHDSERCVPVSRTPVCNVVSFASGEFRWQKATGQGTCAPDPKTVSRCTIVSKLGH